MQVQKLLQESLVSSKLVLLNIRGNDLEVNYSYSRVKYKKENLLIGVPASTSGEEWYTGANPPAP